MVEWLWLCRRRRGRRVFNPHRQRRRWPRRRGPLPCEPRGAGHWGCTGSDYLQAGTLSHLSLAGRGWGISLDSPSLVVFSDALALFISAVFFVASFTSTTCSSRRPVRCSAHLFGRSVRTVKGEVKAKIKISPVVVFGVLSRMVLVRGS